MFIIYKIRSKDKIQEVVYLWDKEDQHYKEYLSLGLINYSWNIGQIKNNKLII